MHSAEANALSMRMGLYKAVLKTDLISVMAS